MAWMLTYLKSGHYNQIIRSETRKLGFVKNEDFAGIHRIVNLPHLLWKLSFNAYHFTDHKHPNIVDLRYPTVKNQNSISVEH